MTLKNYTQHDINLYRVMDGEEVVDVIESNGVARCDMQRVLYSNLMGIPFYKNKLGEVYGLPKIEADTLLIVSRIVAEALKGVRNDLIIVDDTVRDEKNRIIGCRGFAFV